MRPALPRSAGNSLLPIGRGAAILFIASPSPILLPFTLESAILSAPFIADTSAGGSPRCSPSTGLAEKAQWERRYSPDPHKDPGEQVE